MYLKKFFLAALTAVMLIGFGGFYSQALANSADGNVAVMTKNMDAGTDFGFFFADPATGVQLTLQEVLKNDYPARASLLAKEIAAARPDVVGLQEVTIWSTPIGVVDQLQLLLDALAAQGQPYSVVAVNTLTQLSFPVDGGVASFTDRDVIIARVGSPINISNVHTSLYGTLLPLPIGVTVLRGWISADVTAGGNTFRFVTTHLESSGGLYGNPMVNDIQAAQAYELAVTFASSPFPVVIAGDFNSNATHTPPEQTLSYNIMLQAGYVDMWKSLNHGIPGFTWPLYLEDPLRNHTQGPLERIDLVFAHGLSATAVVRTGLKAPYASDHAGVLAIFGL